MSYCIDICFICLKHSRNLVIIRSQDTNGTSIEDKLKYFLPGFELSPNTPKYICNKCGQNLSEIYEFKQLCLRNIMTYEKCAQQITTIGCSFKCLSVIIHPNFVCKEEAIFKENNHETDCLELPTAKEESNEDLSDNTCLNFVDVKAEVFGEDNYDSIIKDETNELIINDESASLLHEFKAENSELVDTCNKNENIVENIQILDNSATFPAGNENTGGSIREKLYKCEICNKSFKWLQSSKKHQLLHTNRESYTCEVCSKSFKQLINLKRHQFTHTGENPYICEVCNKSFVYLTSFNRHKLLHTGKKPFTCEVCNKSFRQLVCLNQHKFLHSDEKPLTCEVCNESFRDLRTIKRHKLTHTDEKPFTCEVCNKSFRYPNSLKTHKLLHTGEKPFTCEVCNKSFRHLSTLKQHQFTHTGAKPFTCKVCNKSFSNLANMKHHQIVHTGAKTFTCEVCNKSFGQLSSLKRHKILHEGEATKTIDM